MIDIYFIQVYLAIVFLPSFGWNELEPANVIRSISDNSQIPVDL